jgi:subtilisin-like proprotein convertase family protein
MCTNHHSGTSASASIAAGIFALVLEANMNLTWRCLQHLIVETSKVTSPSDHDWVINGAGYKVSHKFGFGVLDAASLVALAQTWQGVPEQHICAEIFQINPQSIQTPTDDAIVIPSSGCHGSEEEVNFLEHVVVVISLESTNRGSIQISLTSPMGTCSELLQPRWKDQSKDGMQNWPFMTTHCWGEDPRGQWALHITKTNTEVRGLVTNVMLYLYGTKDNPKDRY